MNAVFTIFAVGLAAIPLLAGIVALGLAVLPGPGVLLAHALVTMASPAHTAATPASPPRITGIVISTLRMVIVSLRGRAGSRLRAHLVRAV